MGRWLHFARKEGARIIGLDVSSAIDVAYIREGPTVNLVQADLLWPPFASGSFDMVYSFGVLHHLVDPMAGVRVLASLVRPGGELRLFIYRSLEDEVWWRRALLAIVTVIRKVTTRLPFALVHAFAWTVALLAYALFLIPRRLFQRVSWGDRLTRGLPLVQYVDIPFRMLVAEQFDRFVAPIEKRYRKEEIEQWVRSIGFTTIAILPGLGWRVIARRPLEEI
jgi:SAM-dependent methyltransferase